MKILIVIGTRPEYLKCKPLYNALVDSGFECTFIHILQHTDLDIDEPKISISIDDKIGNRLSDIGSSILSNLPNYISGTNLVIVQGDTATAFYSALCAFQNKIPIAHIEAGLRTFDLQNPFPEEAYRSLISRIATFHFCPDESAATNLCNEGLTKYIYVVGNTILDQILSYRFNSKLGRSVLITIHRRENWDSIDAILQSVFDVCKANRSLSFTWVYHMNPTLRNKVQEFFTMNPLENLCCVDPICHKDLLSHISSAYAIITDSGGIQEEASFLGKHCFVLRKTTERSSIPSDYITLVKDPIELQSSFTEKVIELQPPCQVYGDGTSSQKITSILKSHLNYQ